MKLRDHLSRQEAQSLHLLSKWVDGGSYTAGQVREATKDIVNFMEWILNAETDGARR